MREVTIRRILGTAVIPIIMLIPTPSHQIPASDIWVVNESGYPVKDVAVTERYGFYAPRILSSDAQGHVRFEPRVPWTSFAHRILASASAATDPIYPGASGFESIVAVGHGMTGNVRMSWSGPPIDRSTRITMHPVYKPIRTTGH
jgi:hypothetical protein